MRATNITITSCNELEENFLSNKIGTNKNTYTEKRNK